MEYGQMLKRAREALPPDILEKARFEVPRVRGHIQGNRTVISNFHQIASTLGRPVDHLLKFILKELATPGELKKNELILGTKVAASRVNEKVEQYVKEFVACSECGKPDTRLMKEDRLVFIKCSACGAKHIVKVKL